MLSKLMEPDQFLPSYTCITDIKAFPRQCSQLTVDSMKFQERSNIHPRLLATTCGIATYMLALASSHRPTCLHQPRYSPRRLFRTHTLRTSRPITRKTFEHRGPIEHARIESGAPNRRYLFFLSIAQSACINRFLSRDAASACGLLGSHNVLAIPGWPCMTS